MNDTSRSLQFDDVLLNAGGEVGERMRRFDWASSPVGLPERWPASLRAIVRTILDSPHPLWLSWGRELTFFCNDACVTATGLRPDRIVGARTEAVWQELWPYVGARVLEVLQHGRSAHDPALLIVLERQGVLRETYHRFAYSPVRDDTLRIAGVLCVVSEVTSSALEERRARTLRGLAAASLAERRSGEEICQIAVSTLAGNARDTPWVAALLIDDEVEFARPVALAGADAALLGLADGVPLAGARAARWPLAEVLSTRHPVLIEGLEGLHVPARPWMQLVSRACAVPVIAADQAGVVAILLVGLSPRLAFDAAYEEFLTQSALYLAQGLAAARLHEEERRRVAALVEVDRSKMRFLSNVSHEFRTPLTLMQGPIEDLLKDERVPPALRARLELAHRNSMRLLKHVDAMLDFSRIEAGKLQASYQPTDLGTLTRVLANAFQLPMQRAGLDFRVECETLDELVFVDRASWEKIVLHLLSNAFKFTLEGQVTVRLRREGAVALLEVIDTGVGVPEGEQKHVFERFYRSESTRGRTFEGSGIGLAFVQELVRLHGGTVGFESEFGRGTRFFVRLPFGSRHLPVDRVRTVVTEVEPPVLVRAFVQEALRSLPEPGGLEIDVEMPSEARASDRRFERTFGARILVADHNADMRAYLRDLLSRSYGVETVADGEAALEAARRRPPDLILADVIMPRLGGLGLLRAVRNDDRLSSVPVVLLSARAGEEGYIEGLDTGADDYLVKPFSARELLARLGALLEVRQLRAQDDARLRMALAAARMVTFDWDIVSNRVQFSENVNEVLGGDWSDRSFSRSLVHPDDWSGHQRAIREAINARGVLRSELRMRRPDTGELRWFEVMGEVQCDSSGEPRSISGASVDVTDRKRIEETLRDVDRRKDEFLAMLAHELRNPLAPIQTGSELLERNFQADDSIHSIAAMVKRQVAQLARLVDDLLDVSRITQGRIDLKREPLELSEVVQRSLESVMPLMREKEHRLESISSISPLYVRGDIARLVQALANLLGNAAKYTERGGQVRVEVRRERGFGVIEVRDTGIGISAELLPRIFELFVQGDRSLDRSQGGLGVGLSVVKRLVEMHGGTVSAASEGERQGSTFQIRLPLISEPLGRMARAPTSLPAEPRRVLVIDDNVDAADTLCMLLKVAGHAAEAVYGARDALERLGQFNAEAALVDIGLPDMNGYDLARHIRARSGRIQLIALTGYGQPEDFVRSREAGFDAHMIKPVEIHAVEAVLARGRPLN